MTVCSFQNSGFLSRQISDAPDLALARVSAEAASVKMLPKQKHTFCQPLSQKQLALLYSERLQDVAQEMEGN